LSEVKNICGAGGGYIFHSSSILSLYLPHLSYLSYSGMHLLCILDLCGYVLASANTGLIFTGIQEGNPGRDTAGRADPTWPNRAGYSIPCAVMLGSGVGGELSRGSGGHSGGAVRQSGSVVLVCFVYSPYLYRCCSCSLCSLFC